MMRVLPALALLAVILVTPAASATTIHTTVSWSFALPNPDVPLGTPMGVSVSGPANGTFAVNLTAPPFDHAYSVFYYTFRLPYVQNHSVTTLNISIPTTDLDLGAYQIQIVNGTTIIGVAVFHTIVPGNISQIAYNLSQDEAQLAADHRTIDQQADDIVYLKGVAWLAVGLGIGFGLPSLVGLFVSRKMAGDETFWRSTRDSFHRMFRARAYQENDDLGTLHTDEEKVLPNPDRFYYSGYCRDCSLPTHWAREEIIAHLKEDHPERIDPSQNGEPREGIDFVADRKMKQEIDEAYRSQKPDRRLLKARDRSFRVDVDDLLRRGN